MIALAEKLGAQKVEIAHVQYYGWATENRAALLPTRAQLDRSLEIIQAAEARLRGRLRVEYVVPDYYARYPKAVHGRLGPQANANRPVRRSPTVPRRESNPESPFRKRNEAPARMDLARIRKLPKIPRRSLDARPLPHLRPPHNRLRRLPLPSPTSSWRRRRNRSSLLALPQARTSHSNNRSRQFSSNERSGVQFRIHSSRALLDLSS